MLNIQHVGLVLEAASNGFSTAILLLSIITSISFAKTTPDSEGGAGGGLSFGGGELGAVELPDDAGGGAELVVVWPPSVGVSVLPQDAINARVNTRQMIRVNTLLVFFISLLLAK